LKAQSFINFK